MSMIKMDIDTSSIDDIISRVEQAFYSRIQAESVALAQAMKEKMAKEAQKKLKSRLKLYVDAIMIYDEDGGVVLELHDSVDWIENGVPQAYSMVDNLLKNAKTSKDGRRYAVIPFNHGSSDGPRKIGAAQREIQRAIKKEMSQRKIPFGKLERDMNGAPLLGRLHSFSVTNPPTKKQEGPGWGWGKLGDPMAGKTGIPFTSNVNVYQEEVRDKNGNKSVKRSIVTFRTVVEEHKSQGRWVYPAKDGVHILSDIVEWANREISKKIIPRITAEIISQL